MMRRSRAWAALLAGCIALAGCASNEAKLADATTQAVYNNDVNGVTQNFDSTLRTQVTRAEVGALSDKMHALGDYKGLTPTGTEQDGAYDFTANFSGGNLIVKMKLDGDGKIAGYRVLATTSSG